jgi:hypothetical protein
VVPGGNDAGGHGVPLEVDPDAPGFVCDVPEELPAEFVEPEFGKLEFVEPEFVEPEFAEPEFVVIGSDPGFAVAGLEPGFEVAGFVEPAVPGALPGSVPHGDPLGVLPGLFVVFGFTVEGDVRVPEVRVPENSIPACFPEKSRSATIHSGGFAETFAELSVVSQVAPMELRSQAAVLRSGPEARPSGLAESPCPANFGPSSNSHSKRVTT